jgi:hypothetical protein
MTEKTNKRIKKGYGSNWDASRDIKHKDEKMSAKLPPPIWGDQPSVTFHFATYSQY